jgi:hypothetical protein
MTVIEWIGLGLALIAMLVGVVGCLLPAVPGTPLVLAAAVIHRLCFGERSVGLTILLLMAFVTAIALVLDYAASVLGTRKMGASWRGVLGAIVGAFIGLFFSIPGILLGPLLGALLFEYYATRDFRQAGKAGLGAVLGMFVGALGKFVCAVGMTLLFLAAWFFGW